MHAELQLLIKQEVSLHPSFIPLDFTGNVFNEVVLTNLWANCGLRWSLNICAPFDIKETLAHSNPSSSETTNPSRISPGDLDKSSNKLMFTVWMQSYRTFEEALSRLPFSSSPFPLIHPQPWRNCIGG